MHIECDFAKIELVNEPIYTFGSADNSRTYAHEVDLAAPYGPTAIHGVLLDGLPLVVFGATSASGVHAQSAISLHGQVLIAVGDHVVSLCPKPYRLNWSLKIDSAACFGIHYRAENDALISHGELEIARFSEDGRILWTSSGADIFSEGFALQKRFIEVVDFNRNTYRFSYESGLEDV